MGKHWLDGIYVFTNEKSIVHQVKGEVAFWRNFSELDHPEYCPHTEESGSWKFGDFGEAAKEIQDKTGLQNYNLQMKYWGGIITQNGVISADGKTVTCFDAQGKLNQGRVLSDEELKKMQEERDHVSTPKTFYKLQPENQGKIIWLSGPPGAGKSTSGLMLAKLHNYVYYEADAFMFGCNPYIPLDVTEPSLCTMSQPPLKGKSLAAVKASTEIGPEFAKMMAGAPFDEEKCFALYGEMAKAIQVQKRRIGGTFAVAHAVINKRYRNFIRDILGHHEVIFVNLVMSSETNMKRCEGRHSKGDKAMQKSFTDAMNKMFKVFEPIEEDEKNSANIEIAPKMSREDVVEAIMKKIQIYL